MGQALQMSFHAGCNFRQACDGRVGGCRGGGRASTWGGRRATRARQGPRRGHLSGDSGSEHGGWQEAGPTNTVGRLRSQFPLLYEARHVGTVNGGKLRNVCGGGVKGQARRADHWSPGGLRGPEEVAFHRWKRTGPVLVRMEAKEGLRRKTGGLRLPDRRRADELPQPERRPGVCHPNVSLSVDSKPLDKRANATVGVQVPVQRHARRRGGHWELVGARLARNGSAGARRYPTGPSRAGRRQGAGTVGRLRRAPGGRRLATPPRREDGMLLAF